MGILPIGFFSPLPLAMMIPFMATQSLAMGEAFGKSFQYGKRKISSMSNEEFNKLTFHDLMVEQTANIRSLIPELKQQMSMSKDMQEAIFREMVDLIPAFFNSLRPKVETDTTNTSQASPYPPITEIRTAGRTEQDLAEQQAKIDALEKLIQEQFFKQRGTKESLAEKLAPPPPPPPPPKPIVYVEPSKQALTQATDPVWRAWSTKMGALKTTYFKLSQVINNPLTSTSSQYRQAGSTNLSQKAPAEVRRVIALLKNKRFGITSSLRKMSQDYRHSNNFIRKNALTLRAQMKNFS